MLSRASRPRLRPMCRSTSGRSNRQNVSALIYVLALWTGKELMREELK
jgi:hypothetical protein